MYGGSWMRWRDLFRTGLDGIFCLYMYVPKIDTDKELSHVKQNASCEVSHLRGAMRWHLAGEGRVVRNAQYHRLPRLRDFSSFRTPEGRTDTKCSAIAIQRHQSMRCVMNQLVTVKDGRVGH